MYSVRNGNTIGAAAAAVSLWLFWQLTWWSKVVVTPHGITVDTFFLRQRIPWAQLSDIRVVGGLRFQLTDGTEVGAATFGNSLAGAVTGYRGLRHVRDKMLAARDRYSAVPRAGEPSHHHERRQQVIITWWVLLAYVALFESIAISADLVSHTH